MKSMITLNLCILLFICSMFSLLMIKKTIQTSFLPSIHQKIDLYLKEQDFQGAVLIAQKGKILFSQGYGFANQEHGISNTIKTVFRIGSITKQFTAVAILQLQEKGLLNVHDPIGKYLPHYPNGNGITLHHLLNHTSGIPSLTEFSNLSEIQRQSTTPQQTIDYFKNIPLKFIPGSKCEYSDSGYIILGAIIEAITKQSYENYLRENIFLPIGMNATYYDHHNSIISHRASGYMKKQNGILSHATFIDMTFPYASGGLASTVEDLYKWNCALNGTSLLTPESLDSLFTIQSSNAAQTLTYGYGFRIGPNNRGMEECNSSIVGHFGTIDGFEAALILYLDNDLSIILLSNVEKTNVRIFHKELARLVYSSWRSCATL